ncbi:MAG: dethiobiotin synthase [Thermodesulfobacteriota bacterium]|nr:dethiobiotin synthase [Thermodesulfobacteriota bacterium]
MKSFFVIGTDTGVGKTVVTGSIAAYLCNKGLKVGVMKPAESGCSIEDGKPVPEDTIYLKKMSGCSLSIDTINPYRFVLPLAPGIAAEMEGKEIKEEEIIQKFRIIKKEHDVTLVEGAGGLYVPIYENKLNSHLVLKLSLPVIIVSRGNLGTINHTLLTVKQAQYLRMKICGVIINYTGPVESVAERTNPEVLKKYLNVPLLGVFPYIEKKEDINCKEFLAGLVKEKIDLKFI